MHTAKLFKNGRSQTVRLPAEFRLEGEEVWIRRDPDKCTVLVLSTKDNLKLWCSHRMAQSQSDLRPKSYEVV